MKQSKESLSKRLKKLLYEHTESEEWHLTHPGKLSPRYATVPRVMVGDTECLLFDWKNILQENTIALIKETRFASIPPHVNQDMELSYMYDGSCDFVVNGRPVTLHKGDIIICDTGVVRSSPSVKGETDIVISMVFRREFFDSVFLSKLPGEGLLTEMLFEVVSRRRRHDRSLVVPARYVSHVRQLMKFIVDEYYFSSLYSQDIIRGYVECLFLELIRGLFLLTRDREERSLPDRRLVEVIDYIEHNYKDCTLGSVAERFGFSQNYLGNLLKAQTGRTFSQIKVTQQMSEARFLLANSDRSITSIAEKVSISNMTYFYRKFHEHVGMSPREYRAEAKGTSSTAGKVR